jgi:hypothetical protein
MQLLPQALPFLQNDNNFVQPEQTPVATATSGRLSLPGL